MSSSQRSDSFSPGESLYRLVEMLYITTIRPTVLSINASYQRTEPGANADLFSLVQEAQTIDSDFGNYKLFYLGNSEERTIEKEVLHFARPTAWAKPLDLAKKTTSLLHRYMEWLERNPQFKQFESKEKLTGMINELNDWLTNQYPKWMNNHAKSI